MLKTVSGCTQDKIQEIERDLKSQGFVEVNQTSALSQHQYKVTSYTGSAESFRGSTKFNIEWHE